MKIFLESQEHLSVELAYRQNITLNSPATISVESGLVWLTTERDDKVLRAGDSFATSEIPMVMSALSASRICLDGGVSARELQIA